MVDAEGREGGRFLPSSLSGSAPTSHGRARRPKLYALASRAADISNARQESIWKLNIELEVAEEDRQA